MPTILNRIEYISTGIKPEEVNDPFLYAFLQFNACSWLSCNRNSEIRVLFLLLPQHFWPRKIIDGLSAMIDYCLVVVLFSVFRLFVLPLQCSGTYRNDPFGTQAPFSKEEPPPSVSLLPDVIDLFQL